MDNVFEGQRISVVATIHDAAVVRHVQLVVAEFHGGPLLLLYWCCVVHGQNKQKSRTFVCIHFKRCDPAGAETKYLFVERVCSCLSVFPPRKKKEKRAKKHSNRKDQTMESNNSPPNLGSDTASANSSASLSLLERIQLQRQREAQLISNNNNNTPQHIQVPVASQPPAVPNYGESSLPGYGNNTTTAPASLLSSSMFQSWSPPPAASSPNDDYHTDLQQGLLLSQPHHAAQEYSMSNYFLTFLADIQALLGRLPVVLRILVFAALFYVALKLI